jgi:hypothetical protein
VPGVGTDPILFTPTSAKDMIEIHSTQLPPEITLTEIIGGFGSNPILFTPATAKHMIQSKGYIIVKASCVR